jgi:hypothetical protein
MPSFSAIVPSGSRFPRNVSQFPKVSVTYSVDREYIFSSRLLKVFLLAENNEPLPTNLTRLRNFD